MMIVYPTSCQIIAVIHFIHAKITSAEEIHTGLCTCSLAPKYIEYRDFKTMIEKCKIWGFHGGNYE
jgi:hypothetical protein